MKHGPRSRKEPWQNFQLYLWWIPIQVRHKLQTCYFKCLGTLSGRSITVRGDLGESLRQLDSVLSRNKVKLQLRMTERHEKKGYKRRRLESERWRKQFANEVTRSVLGCNGSAKWFVSQVRKKVQLVMKMRDRGAWLPLATSLQSEEGSASILRRYFVLHT